MRYSHFAIAAVAVLMATSDVASAQKMPPERTAGTLYEACSSSDKTNLMRCKAYLAGVADSMDFIAAFDNADGAELRKVKLTLKPFAICHAESWHAENLRQIYVDWAKAHPQRMDSDQYIAVVDALHDAFPCK